MNNERHQKFALITGGSKRIGKIISLHLASIGYNIILHYNNSVEQAIQTSEEIKQLGVSCDLIQADFSQNSSVSSFCSQIKQKFNHIDLLVNSAALFARKTLEQSDDQLVDVLLQVNLKTPLFLIKNFAQIMQNGLIINIIDAKIERPDSRYFVYELTKNGLAYLTKLASQEFAPDVRVNGISIGILLKSQEFSKYESFIDKVPLKEYMNEKSLTQALDYLIENMYVTGQILTIDGGYNNIIR